MYSHLVKHSQLASYTHFLYAGKPMKIRGLEIVTGQRLGLKQDSRIRLILDDDLSAIYTIRIADLKQLQRNQRQP